MGYIESSKRQLPASGRPMAYVTGILVVSLLCNIASFCLYFAPPSVPVTSSTENAFLPLNLRTVAMTLNSTPRYGLHDDKDWHSLFGRTHGFVRLPKKGGPSNETTAYYSVTLYHQLHCLNGIRRFVLQANQTQGAISKHSYAHVNHCLSYLRQLSLCQADIALEPAHTIETPFGNSQIASGMGTTHVCRDWTQVREFVEKNYEEWKDDDVHDTSE